jgi:hypothetical protein
MNAPSPHPRQPIVIISTYPLTLAQARAFELGVWMRLPQYLSFFVGWSGGREVYRIASVREATRKNS